MTINIGIDISKEKLDVCWLRDVSTSKKKRKIFRNKRQSFAEIIQWLSKSTKTEAQTVLMTLEATGVYPEALIYFLHEQGFQLFLANPGKAKKFAESLGRVHKTDKSDAAMLARYGSSQPDKVALWQPEALEVRELKALLRRLDALEKDCQREKNRLEASEISDNSVRVLQSIRAMILRIETEIVGLKQEIDDHIDRYPELKRNHTLLKSI